MLEGKVILLLMVLLPLWTAEQEGETIKFDRSSNDTVRIAVILPKSTDYLSSISKVGPAISMAIDKVKSAQLLPGWKWNVHYMDSQCSSAYGLMHAVRCYIEDRVHLFLGPVCDYATAPIARLLKFWDIPLLTTGALARDYGLNKSHYDTEYYLLTRVGFSFNGAVSFLLEIFNQFAWRKMMLLYDSEARTEITDHEYCLLWTKALVSELRLVGSYKWEHYKLSGRKMTEDDVRRVLLDEIGTEHGVIVMCASPRIVREIMIAAKDLGMVDNGEYIFFSLELYGSKREITKPWYQPQDDRERNRKAREAYQALFTLTAEVPDCPEYREFSRNVKRVASEEFEFDYGEEEVNSFVAGFYEAVILYATVLNETIQDGFSITNGSVITQKMWNRTFQGLLGPVTINANGDRNVNYTLMNIVPHTGIFQPVAVYDGSKNVYVPVNGGKIYWPGKRKRPPKDTPVCGYNRSKCLKSEVPQYAIVCVILSCVIFALCLCSVLIYRHFRLEAEIASMTWRIRWEDLIPISPSHVRHLGSKMSLTRISIQTSCSSITMEANMTKQLFARTGYFKGSIVAIKPIHQTKIDINRSLLCELKNMKDLQHNHVVRFLGACIDPPHCCLVTEYCPKGSLQDILENDEIKLDWMFQCSLMHDIVKGMTYLHSTELHSHGNLKSSNCVVDSRFVLKITDFGLHSLRSYDENDNEDSYAHWRRKIWMAPELLRKAKPPPRGTQKGDVYSFAIVAHEIVVRQGPFYLGPVELSPKEIVENVKNKQGSPFRPYIGESVCEEGAKMITKCWAEDAAERPDFQCLKSVIRRLNRENESGNILDNLLSRMEQYANNLEALVEERTTDYLEEKRKAEDLLYQLLPRTVASQLIVGESVTAEAYESVTIYFSDIVGFTLLSAQSTPMQVVDFLNDLYSCFDSIIENYDVYKVETIGDAYMVVSGLPTKNGNSHVREIARMSLALLNAVKNFTIRHKPQEQLKLRIGLHTGPCAAGIVGHKMPRYCLFGDTVNTASRMESTGLPLKIHVSSQTKEALSAFRTFILELRGEVEMKGKGKQITYWLLGEDSASCDGRQCGNNDMTNTVQQMRK